VKIADPTRQALAWWGLACGALLVSISVLWTLRNFGPEAILDYRVYRDAVALWLQTGADPYTIAVTESGLPFTYPPFAVIALSPLAAIPFAQGATLWLALTYTTTALTAAVLWAQPAAANIVNGSRLMYCTCVAVTTGLALQLEPFKATIDYGQINTVLLALVITDCMVVRGRWKGVLIGAAIAVKLTPAVFLIWFIWKRDFRAAGNALLTSMGLTAIAAIFLPGETFRYFTSTLLDSGRIGWQGFVGNQSLNGMLMRWFGEAPWTPLLWIVVSVLALVVLVIALRKLDRVKNQSMTDLLGICLVALFGLLASPVSWTHHWIWVMPIAVVGVITGSRVFAVSAAILTGITFLAPLWAAKVPNGQVNGDAFQRYVTSNSYVLAAIALMIAMALVPARRTTDTEPWAQNANT
jgi:alpha-1,2-mannosyltransferase